MHSLRLQSLLFGLLVVLLALTVPVSAAPLASAEPRSIPPLPKSLPREIRHSALKLLTRLSTRVPRIVDTSELRLLLATSPTRTRQSIRSNVSLALARLVPRTRQEEETLRIGRALDGVISKKARKEERRLEKIGKRGRREEARKRVRGLVRAAARARKGLKRRLMGARKVGRWEGREVEGKVVVMALGKKDKREVATEGKGWKGQGRRMVKGVVGMRHVRSTKEGRRMKRAVVDYTEGEEEQAEMETDV